jgi:hypothetical protein
MRRDEMMGLGMKMGMGCGSSGWLLLVEVEGEGFGEWDVMGKGRVLLRIHYRYILGVECL